MRDEKHTISSHNGGTPREAVYAMNEDYTARTKGFIDKAAGMRHPNEEVLVRVILNGDTEVPYTRVWMFGRDGFGANRNNVCNTALCQRAGRLCRNETRGRRR
jgi:hypothetical protein